MPFGSFDPCRHVALFVAWVLVQAGALPAWAGETDRSESFYENSKEGWFWGKDPMEAQLPDEPSEAPLPGARAPRPSLDDYALEELWSLHPDEFRPLWEAVWKDAVASPNDENKMVAYKKLEKIASLRAARFASMATLVTLKHPELSTSVHSPSANPGLRAKRTAAHAEIQATLSTAQDEFALLYFVSPGCPFCLEQDRILAFFTEKYGWEIKRVDVTAEPRAAHLFGISTTPTLLLVQRDNDVPLPASVGVVALPALERNLYRGIRLLRGAVSPEDWWLYEFQRGGGYDPNAMGPMADVP